MADFYTPDFCDWRMLDPCPITAHRGFWRNVYAVHTAWAGVLCAVGSYIVYQKIYLPIWSVGKRLMVVVNRGLKPRATEIFALLSTVHLLLRAIYTTVALSSGFGSAALTEIMFDLPWIILFIGGVAFNVGLIYATPRFKMSSSSNGDAPLSKVSLPGPLTLNVLFAAYSFIPLITLPIFAGLDGHYRDLGNWDRARHWNRMHYGFWSSYCVALAGLYLWYGTRLVMLLKQANQMMKGGETSKQSAEYRMALRTLIIILTCITVLLILSAIVMACYAAFKYEIHVREASSYLVGLIWTYISCVLLLPFFAVSVYHIHIKPPTSFKNSSGSDEARSRKKSVVAGGHATFAGSHVSEAPSFPSPKAQQTRVAA
ncbi:hypothetical protein BC832DRAFT_594320 [Gaertneriomyces semiglobifer]|nr:hypothetical protein BC832DRAFT_594320 [Gaertneriomyces semiglobifer]